MQMMHDPSKTTNVGESFHSSVLSIHLFFLYLFPQSCWNGSLISPLEASIQRLIKLSTDITNFTFHPFSASNVATTTASRRVPHSNSLPDLLRHYPIFFLPLTILSILLAIARDRPLTSIRE